VVVVERRKRVKRHDRLMDHLGANPDLLEPGLILRGKEVAVSTMSGEGGSIDLLSNGVQVTYFVAASVTLLRVLQERELIAWCFLRIWTGTIHESNNL